MASAPPKQLTSEGRNTGARFSPDSKQIAWISTKGGSAQIWVMDANGSNPKQVTKLATVFEIFDTEEDALRSFTKTAAKAS